MASLGFNQPAMLQAAKQLKETNDKYLVGHSFDRNLGFTLELRIQCSREEFESSNPGYEYIKEFEGFPVNTEFITEVHFG